MKSKITAAVAALRPTQMTVPLSRVEYRRRQLRAARERQLQDFLTWHVMPAVLGPDLAVYLIGDHHIARALADENVATCFVTLERDMSAVSRTAFWVSMERSGWVYPVDEHGRRRSFANIPRTLGELKDDPYRSLVGDMREYGAIEGNIDVAAEYAWAGLLRSHIPLPLVTSDYTQARSLALTYVRTPAASRLPGFRAS
ncbi:MAG: hypothetical protein IT532_02915 [Burkholderiales bacterium]|nr:hypothetical protein [Burkholderiales bacterium]